LDPDLREIITGPSDIPELYSDIWSELDELFPYYDTSLLDIED